MSEPPRKKQKKEKKEKKSKKDKRKREDDSEDGGSKRSSLPLVISPIAQPLAGEKLTKKLLKLVKIITMLGQLISLNKKLFLILCKEKLH